VFAEKVLSWRFEDDRGRHEGEEAFQRFLVRKAHEQCATKRINWGDCAFVPEARSMHAALARQRTSDEAEWKHLYEEELKALQDRLEEKGGEVTAALQLAEEAEKERDHFKEQNAQLRAHNETLRRALADTAARGTPEADATRPDTYAAIPEWVGEQFSGRLVLHPRAVNALKNARYGDIGPVCRALESLATHYRDMRLGHDGARDRWEDALARDSLQCSKSVTANRAGEEGDTYYVSYPPGSKRDHLLEFHLKKGTNRDPRYCLRIYYFWHDETQEVVVGWLPSHLQTRQS
jgi:hypothetical protein